MDTDDEEKDDLNTLFELEEATEIVDELQTYVASINLNEALSDKLIDFPSPKVSASRKGIKSMHMEQMMLLKKMDPKRLKEKYANNSDCCNHECKHFKKLLQFPWKVK